MRTLRAIVRGLGDVPGYGPHPGVPVVLFLIAITTLAGASRGGWAGVAFGFGVSVLVYVPMLLYGAWDRGRQ